MSREKEVQQDIYDMLLEYICSSETVGYCNDCPDLRYISDVGCYDCPYGLDVASCEYSPAAQLEMDVDKIMRTIEACKP